MFVSWMNTVTEDPAMFITGCFYCVGENMFMFPLTKPSTFWIGLLWSSIFVTLVAKKYHESVTLPSGLRMVYDNH